MGFIRNFYGFIVLIFIMDFLIFFVVIIVYKYGSIFIYKKCLDNEVEVMWKMYWFILDECENKENYLSLW